MLGDDSVLEMQEELDVEVRIEDTDPDVIAAAIEQFQFTHLFVDQFEDSKEVRFPENRKMTVTEALEYFNPKSFPAHDDPEIKDFERELFAFGAVIFESTCFCGTVQRK